MTNEEIEHTQETRFQVWKTNGSGGTPCPTSVEAADA